MTSVAKLPVTQAAFAELAERHRRELQVHCYRMLGSFDEAEDLVPSPSYLGSWRSLPTWANRQPAAGQYVRRSGTTVYRAQVLDVLRVEGGKVVARAGEARRGQPHHEGAGCRGDRADGGWSGADDDAPPAPRLAQVAEVAASLASDRAGAMTGTVTNVTCGLVPG